MTASLSGAEPATTDRAALEKDFADKLTGATLAGTFSIVGRDASKPERYDIDSAEKLEGDNWVITARVKYGDKDVKLPIVVKVYWADDTPVISLTDLAIPGLGTFTSRVMFYGDRYAGTWQHDAVGGHMWGRVEKTKPADDTKKP
ncbi:MAG: hypothetical protein B7Z55_13650 [Planctomycetales bacterium 12-60-4]|nr:MAG: hypothetical protein B7Z55_13650 [Planctomycetales bacterium 12-60-4]